MGKGGAKAGQRRGKGGAKAGQRRGKGGAKAGQRRGKGGAKAGQRRGKGRLTRYVEIFWNGKGFSLLYKTNRSVLPCVCSVEDHAHVCTKHQQCKGFHFYIHHSLVVFPLLLVFLFFEDRSCVLALVGPGVNMCCARTSKNAVTPGVQKPPAFISSLASRLVTVEWRLNTSLSSGCRSGSASTFLHTLLMCDNNYNNNNNNNNNNNTNNDK